MLKRVGRAEQVRAGTVALEARGASKTGAKTASPSVEPSPSHPLVEPEIWICPSREVASSYLTGAV